MKAIIFAVAFVLLSLPPMSAIAGAPLAAPAPAFADDAAADAHGSPNEAEPAHDDIHKWLEAQKAKSRGQLDRILEMKIFQTHVFFGGGLGFLLLLAALFFTKFAFNLIRDSLYAVYAKVLAVFGRDAAYVPRHLSPLGNVASPVTVEEGFPARAATASPKKKLLFGEVLTHFVNPLVKPELIAKALDEQKAKTPKPRLGEVLVEMKAVTPADVEKALILQRRYRS